MRAAGWLGGAALLVLLATPAGHAAESHVVVEAGSGAVLLANDLDLRIPPASLTKMMTAYLVFEALRDGRLKPTDSFTASARAAATAPVVVGLAVGETVPVMDALRALLGLSANDVAVMIAEALEGSEEAFAQRMTATAQRLGLRHTRFASASGLPAPLEAQHTTARDMAVLALALGRDFPQHRALFALQGFSYKGRPMAGHNALLGRVPGADGMKTGFTCASGYNIVGSVTRDGRRLIGVLLGSATGPERTGRIEALLQKAWAVELTEKTPFITDPEPPGPVRPVADNRARTPLCAGSVVSAAVGERLSGGGFALDVGLGKTQGEAGALAARVAARVGGVAYTLPRAGTGLMRWAGYVGGLPEATARRICGQRQAAGEWCLVRTPEMIRADVASAARLRRAAR